MPIQVERYRKQPVQELLRVYDTHDSVCDDLHNIKDFYQKFGGDFFILSNNQKIVGMYGYLPQNHKSVTLKRFQIKNNAYNEANFKTLLQHFEEQVIARGFRAATMESIPNTFVKDFRKNGYLVSSNPRGEKTLQKSF